MEYLSIIKGWAFFALLLLGPLPALMVGYFYLNNVSYSLRRFVLGISIGWCLVQTTIVFLLGRLHILTYSGVLITQLVLFLLGIGLLTRVLSPTLKDKLQSTLSVRLATEEKIIILVMALIGLLLWYRTSSQPVSNFDSLYYHLPMTVNWFQTGTLDRLPEYGQISQYPFNWEMVASLFLFAFHTDFQVGFANLVIWFIFGFSIFVLAREFGANRLASIFTVCLIMQFPLVRSQLNTLQVDLPFAGFFLASLYFLYDFLKSHNLWSLNLFFASSGMLLGIKMSGFGYLLLLVLWGVSLAAELKLGWHFNPASIYKTLPGLFLMFTLGGHWYITNWLEVGNPMGYLKVGVGPLVLFEGVDLNSYLKIIHPQFPELTSLVERQYDHCRSLNECIPKTTMMSVFRPLAYEDWKILWYEIQTQSGRIFPIYLVLALSGIYYLIKKKGFRSGITIGFLLVIIGAAFMYWITPYSGDNGSHLWKITPWIGQALRYAFPFIGGLIVISAYGLSFLPIPRFILLISFLLFTYLILPEMGLFLVVLGIGYICVVVFRMEDLRLHPYLLGLSGSLLAIFVILFLSLGKFQREQLQIQQINSFENVLDANLGQGSSIGYVASFFRYPLYGIHLNHDVKFAAAHSDNRQEWLGFLKKEHIQLVSIGPFRDEEWLRIYEYVWMNEPDGRFERIYGSDPKTGFVIYKLKP